MKKMIVSILVVVMLVLSSMSVFAYDESALDTYACPKNTDIGSHVAKNGSPTVDANITEGEGWSDAKYIDYVNMPTLWGSSSRCIISGNLYFAWDDSGLYFAADITDPTMVYSKSEVTDGTDDSSYGYDGDVFVFAIDPADVCFNEASMVSRDEKSDRSVWYCVSMFEGGTVKVWRSNCNDGEITDVVTVAGTSTTTGWAFECKLPWDIVIEDVLNHTLGDADVTKEEITALGTVSSVGIQYMDRAVLTEDVLVFKGSSDPAVEGDVFTLSRNISMPLIHADSQGMDTGGTCIISHGLKLAMGDAEGNAPETTTEATETTPAPETTPKEEETEDDETESSTESTAKTTVRYDDDGNLITEAPGDGAADEDDGNKDGNGGLGVPTIIGIVAAAVAVVAVVVIIIVKKKK